MDYDFNKKQYNEHADLYVQSNLDGLIGGKNKKLRVDFVSQYLAPGSIIFEIGSGDGGDALEFKKREYEIIASDFSSVFIEMLNKKGVNSVYFDIKKDTPPKFINLLYANAVFVHISPQDFDNFLSRCKKQYAGNNVKLFATFIDGHGSERSKRGRGFERDFFYYSVHSIKETMNALALKIDYLEKVDEKWIWLVATF